MDIFMKNDLFKDAVFERKVNSKELIYPSFVSDIRRSDWVGYAQTDWHAIQV
jgi:hypothetical protein